MIQILPIVTNIVQIYRTLCILTEFIYENFQNLLVSFEPPAGLPYKKEVRGPILKQHIISCHIFSVQHPKRYHKIFHCGPFEAEYPNSYQNHFLNPQKVLASTPVLLI